MGFGLFIKFIKFSFSIKRISFLHSIGMINFMLKLTIFSLNLVRHRVAIIFTNSYCFDTALSTPAKIFLELRSAGIKSCFVH